MSYKQRKVVEIMAEITAIKGQTSYDVSGVKPEVARVCYRLPTENFKDLTSGDYTWTTTGSGYSLQINNEVVRNTAEAYQVYYVHDIQSSKYTTDFEVDINTLVTRYNEAVDDIHRLWLFTQKLAFVSDDTTIPIILPQLGEDEIWMRKGDGYVGVTLTDAEGMILDMINKYVTDKKQEISDHVTAHVTAELVKADKHILDETLKRIQEITEHTNVMKQEITDLTTAQKKILLDYVNLTLKPMLLAYVNDELKPMLLTYVNTVLKPDLESYTTAKKGELNTATQGHLQTLINKTNELLALLVAKESELETALSNLAETLKTALNNHTNEKKSEITIHANSESQRVQAEVVAKGEEVKDEVNQLIPDNLGVRVGALEGNRVLRSGDTMTGTLNINMESKDKVVLKSKDVIDGVVGSDADGVIVGNSKSGNSIRLNNDGVGIYPSTSLKTEAKDLSGAVNELLDNKHKIEYKIIGSTTEELNILDFALTAVKGNYKSQSGSNLITGLPDGVSKAFECRITSINESAGYSTIELKPFNSNDVYINTQRSSKAGEDYPVWIGWNKLLNDRDGSDFVKKVGDEMTGTLIIKGQADNKSVLYNEGFIDLHKDTNPVVRFYNTEGGAYIGRYGQGVNAINIGNSVSNCFYRIYDNGVHEALLNSATAYYDINFSNANRDGSFILKSSATATGTNGSGHNGHIVFQNTYQGSLKSISATATDHRSFIFVNHKTLEYPSIFKFRNSAGSENQVDLVWMTNNINNLNETYLNRGTGGTIFGPIDVRNTHNANSYYSRGTIVSAGAITSSDNVTAYSDKRLKKNIRPLHDCLELISKLDVYRYDWKENGKKDIGVIAQEVEEVFPEFVIEVQDETKGTVKTVDYAKLATISLKGIKELVGMISELRDDIKQLKEEVNGKTQNR